MSKSTFPYPGGKTRYAQQIINVFPDHECYVEPFGGAANVLFQKPRSRIEVYNDINSDVVTFFSVVRRREDELREWLRTVPYSREVHREWAQEWFDGERPDDDIERAGRFFALQHMQYGGAIDRVSGFDTSRPRASGGDDCAGQFSRSRRSLDEVAERFDGVVVENDDYADVIERYDSEETLFYCDPPYMDTNVSYGEEFDHGTFVDVLQGCSGRWVVSYTQLPSGLEGYPVVAFDGTHSQLEGGVQKPVSERLVMNFDPDETPSFAGGGVRQEKLTATVETDE